MKTRYLIIAILLFAVNTQAQILKPVKWSFSAVPVKSKAGMYKVSMTAVIEKGWHIYSQNTPDGGPSATKMTFAKNPLVLLGGKTTEVGKLHKEHSEVFGVDVLSYSDKVEFVQVVKVKKALSPRKGDLSKRERGVLKGTVEFMACDASQCLPPEELSFSILIK